MHRPITQRSVRRTGAILATVASAALVLSACGGGDSTASDLNPDADLTQQLTREAAGRVAVDPVAGKAG